MGEELYDGESGSFSFLYVMMNINLLTLWRRDNDDNDDDDDDDDNDDDDDGDVSFRLMLLTLVYRQTKQKKRMVLPCGSIGMLRMLQPELPHPCANLRSKHSPQRGT